MAITAAVGGGNWNAGGTWVGGVVPTAADDVLFTATSGNITIPAAYTGLCRSLDCTGYTGTLAIGGNNLSIGDASGGACKFVSTMGLTFTGGAGQILLNASTTNGGNGWLFTTGGKSQPIVACNNAGGKWKQGDAFSGGEGLNVIAGTWDTSSSNFSLTVAWFASTGTATRGLILNGSVVYISNGYNLATPWSISGTGLTLSAGTSNISTNSTAAFTFAGNGLTYATVAFGTLNVAVTITGANTFGAFTASNSGVLTLSAGNTFASFVRNGGANQTSTTVLGANQTVTGNVTLASNSSVNRMVVNGAGFSLTCNGTVRIDNPVLFRDFTGAGSASWDLSGASVGGGANSRTGDMGNNSGLTFTTAATQTWQGTSGGNWSDVTKWTSRVPLPQDNVVIASAFTASQTITSDMLYLGHSITWTGVTGSPAWTVPAATANFFGDLTLSASMGTITLTGTLASVAYGTTTWTSNGKTIDAGVSYLCQARAGSTVNLADALTTTGAGFWLQSGTFNTNNYNVTCPYFLCFDFGLSLVTVNAGTSTITITATAAAIGFYNQVTCVFNGVDSTIVYTGVTATAGRIFRGGNATLGAFVFTVAGSSGRLDFITGASFSSFTVSDASGVKALRFTAGQTFTIRDPDGFAVIGRSGALITIDTTAAGSPATISSAVNQHVDYVSLKDSTASGGGRFLAYHSTNVSGNTGWVFTVPSSSVPPPRTRRVLQRSR